MVARPSTRPTVAKMFMKETAIHQISAGYVLRTMDLRLTASMRRSASPCRLAGLGVRSSNVAGTMLILKVAAAKPNSCGLTKVAGDPEHLAVVVELGSLARGLPVRHITKMSDRPRVLLDSYRAQRKRHQHPAGFHCHPISNAPLIGRVPIQRNRRRVKSWECCRGSQKPNIADVGPVPA